VSTNPERAQEWQADRYAEHAHFVPRLGQAILDLLKARPGERILDLGCGDGVLSENIKATGATVVGVDASTDMIAAAKRRGIDARIMDGFDLTFDAEFDAVFSNAALHWMKRDPGAVIAGVRRALRPGGRFVGEMGGHGNVAAITVAAVGVLEQHGIKDAARAIPWFYPTVDAYRELLQQNDLVDEYMELIPRPTALPTGMRGWLETFAIPFLKRLPEAERQTALDEMVAKLRPVLCDEQERWTADYVRLRFLARARN
jgi:trans-aconitate methyltransferase